MIHESFVFRSHHYSVVWLLGFLSLTNIPLWLLGLLHCLLWVSGLYFFGKVTLDFVLSRFCGSRCSRWILFGDGWGEEGGPCSTGVLMDRKEVSSLSCWGLALAGWPSALLFLPILGRAKSFRDQSNVIASESTSWILPFDHHLAFYHSHSSFWSLIELSEGKNFNLFILAFILLTQFIPLHQFKAFQIVSLGSLRAGTVSYSSFVCLLHLT